MELLRKTYLFKLKGINEFGSVQKFELVKTTSICFKSVSILTSYVPRKIIFQYLTIFSTCSSHYNAIIKFIFSVHCCCTDVGFYILGFTFSASKHRIHLKYYSNHIQLVLHPLLFYNTVYILKAPWS